MTHEIPNPAAASAAAAAKRLAKQLVSTLGAVFAAACCLGVPAALSVLTAVGAGFLIRDAFLIPAFLALCALSLGLLYISARAHASLRPFWLGLAGGVAAVAGLWVATALVLAGLAALVAANLWDFAAAGRKASAAAQAHC